MLETGGTLLAEAGTGTGKTLAYLDPAILSGQRVLVSTGTKNLQEQIYFKDIPALAAALGVTFTATLMKGRSNYLCLHRFQTMEGNYERGGRSRRARCSNTARRPKSPAGHPRVGGATDTGDRAELADLPEDLALWNHISATAETCLGAECPQYTDCFVTRMRQRANDSDVVIVNHHLLCADASVRKGSFGEVIPSCTSLVVDEAHQLEDVATQYFGLAFSNYRFDEFVRDADQSLSAARATLDADEAGDTAWEPRQIESAGRSLTRVGDHGRQFFQRLADARAAAASAQQESRVRYTGGRCGEGAGDRGGCHHGRARHRSRVGVGSGRCADRHCLHVLSGIDDIRAAPRRAQGLAQRQHGVDQCHDRTAGARHHEPGDARHGSDQRRGARVPIGGGRAGAAAGEGGSARFRRLYTAVVRTGRRARPRDAGA